MATVNKLRRAKVRKRKNAPSAPETSLPKLHGHRDRRVVRNQRSLHQAMMGLVLEKGFKGTTVDQITARANVGRSTLYEHHGSKEGVLLSGLAHFRVQLLNEQNRAHALPVAAPARHFGFSAAFFQHLDQFGHLLHALARSGDEGIATRALQKILTELVARELATLPAERGGVHVPRPVLVRTLVAIFETVMQWRLEQQPAPLAEHVDAICRRLVLGTLASAGYAPDST
jgi:AcrR family transcriptional regulator